MSDAKPQRNSLVLYKQGAARIVESGAKRITIELRDGQQLRVRPKDVLLLHPGPVDDLMQLAVQRENSADLLTAWELLAGSETSLPELAELAYGEYTPAAAWSVWEAVADGLYFSGEPQHITVYTREEVQQERAKREAREAERRQWDEFLQRITDRKTVRDDHLYLRDVEALALGEQSQSRVLNSLGKDETPESAHDLLLQVGYWDISRNPYPSRAKIISTSATGPAPPLSDEARRDLTHLQALAIDDEGNEDPDDAISWDNGRVWVHIADVAALIDPDSTLDRTARDRAANLYLPEETILMLPQDVTKRLGLGLEEKSPALSFGIDLSPDGQIEDLEIVSSWIKATRWTYEEAENRITEPILSNLLEIAQRYEHRRREAGAIDINLPEVRIRVENGDVIIKPILPLQSRSLVREAMLMAGEAAAMFAQENEFAIPYTTQEPPAGPIPEGETMSAMFATRKLLKPGRQSVMPGVHSGLGMAQYAQATSPLRRYLDLVVHQQLRAHLQGRTPLSEQAILERIGAVDLIQRDVRRAERLSRQHWTLVYLLKNPDWQGEGIIVEKHGRRLVAVLPDLDLETDLYLPGDHALDSSVLLEIQDISLPYLTTRFTSLTAPQNP